jgi:GDP-mannose 6-dehydrogenase
VFGLGYVGSVSAACFSKLGHQVVGVDVNPVKIEMINRGTSPIVEPGIDELIAAGVRQKRLRATSDARDALRSSDVSLVCVGTPGNHNGSLDLAYVRRVCEQIGAALASKPQYHVVAIRSTLLPGATTGTIVPLLEAHSGKRTGRDFGVAVNPEFLREGSSIQDFNTPPFNLIGAEDEDAASTLKRLYAHMPAPVITTAIKEAEMVKYACNAFHALKVTFANEIGGVCKALGVDSHKVMDVFCRDTKLNLSASYLKPGFAFGGSCLPKDMRAILYRAKELDVELPVLKAVMASNRAQIEKAVDLVLQTGKKTVGVLGMSFKAGTDDLRESPMVTLIETLIGKGLKLSIYDRDVEMGRLFGANKEYIEREIPHISSLMQPRIQDVLDNSDVIVIGKNESKYRVAGDAPRDGRIIIDLVRLLDTDERKANYQGVCW